MSRGVYSSWTGLDEVVMNGDGRSPVRGAACWRVVSSQLSNACRSSSNCWRSNMPLSGGRGRDYPAALIESVKEGRGIIARRFLAPAPAVLVRQRLRNGGVEGGGGGGRGTVGQEEGPGRCPPCWG